MIPNLLIEIREQNKNSEEKMEDSEGFRSEFCGMNGFNLTNWMRSKMCQDVNIDIVIQNLLYFVHGEHLLISVWFYMIYAQGAAASDILTRSWELHAAWSWRECLPLPIVTLWEIELNLFSFS